jgi:hypothetical protein
MADPIDNLKHDPEPDERSGGWPFLAHWKHETPRPKRHESTVDDNESKLAIR